MGPRDGRELTPDDEELATEEAAMRRLLARLGEPVQAEPPPTLAARVVAGLPRGAPRRPAHPWRNALWGSAAAALVLLLSLGAWGVLINSLGPARVAGDPAAGIGELVLIFTLAAKPLVNLLVDAGLAAALAAAAIVGAAALWWRIVQRTPIAQPVESQL